MRAGWHGVAAAAALAIATSASAAETLTNADVVALVAAGLGDEAVIAKIRVSANRFELSSAQLIALRRQKVSSAVIAAMLAAPVPPAPAASQEDAIDWRVPRAPGVYLAAPWLPAPRMLRIDATTANQTKTGGMLGYALTGGIVPLRMKSVIPNAAARIRAASARPAFFFYFDAAKGASTAAWSTGPAMAVASPGEFSLVRFDVKADRREARVGSFNIAGAKTGVMDRDRIAFTFDAVAPGVFRVVPAADLAPGEYGFLHAVSAGSGPGMFAAGVMTARVFDFAVEDAAP